MSARAPLLALLLVGCAGRTATDVPEADAFCASAATDRGDAAISPDTTKQPSSSPDTSATIADTAPPEPPCADVGRAIPHPTDLRACYGVVRLAEPARTVIAYRFTCTVKDETSFAKYGDDFTPRARYFASAFAPSLLEPSETLRGFPHGFFRPRVGETIGYVEFVALGLPYPLLLVSWEPYGSIRTQPWMEVPKAPSFCRPAKMPVGHAVYPAAGPAFDDALATKIARIAWDTPLGMAWEAAVGVDAAVYRYDPITTSAPQEWFVLFPLQLSEGGAGD